MALFFIEAICLNNCNILTVSALFTSYTRFNSDTNCLINVSLVAKTLQEVLAGRDGSLNNNQLEKMGQAVENRIVLKASENMVSVK